MLQTERDAKKSSWYGDLTRIATVAFVLYVCFEFRESIYDFFIFLGFTWKAVQNSLFWLVFTIISAFFMGKIAKERP